MLYNKAKELFVLPGLLGDSHFGRKSSVAKTGANLASSPDDIMEYFKIALGSG